MSGFLPEFRPRDQGLRQFITAFRTAFPDLTMQVEDVFGENDRVVFRFTTTGTHQGELFGIPPTERKVVVPGMVIARFESGMWAEDWANYDQLAMLQQLGVIPQMEQAPA